MGRGRGTLALHTWNAVFHSSPTCSLQSCGLSTLHTISKNGTGLFSPANTLPEKKVHTATCPLPFYSFVGTEIMKNPLR